MPNFQYPASLRRPLSEDDAEKAARLLSRGDPEPTASNIAWLAAILTDAYAPERAAQAAVPDASAFEAVIGQFGGRLVAQSVQYLFWSGGGAGDRPLTAADLTDPAVVRHLAEAMGADTPEEESDAWNAYAAQRGGLGAGPGASPGPEGIDGEGTTAGEEGVLAARERAEYDRLRRSEKDAAALRRRLERDVRAAERGSASGAEVFSRWQLAIEAHQTAAYEATAYLQRHPAAVPIYAAARRFHDLGISTVPPRNDGSKRPVGEWKEYQQRLPTDEELLYWHQDGTSGLGIATGRTDRADGCGTEMFEPEGRAVDEGVFDEFLGHIADAGLTEVWERIAAGYRERTPGGGNHYYWLCTEYSGNLKLAMRPATDAELAENPKDKYRTLLETRGKGGYSVAAPTPGSFHESGRPWAVDAGSPESTAVITPEEREAILRCARMCSKVPPGAAHENPERAKHETLRVPDGNPSGGRLGTRPGDIYNERGPDWAEILVPHGWRPDRAEDDGTRHWTRPGKAAGTSATTGNPQHEGDRLHCFTSSTEFEPGVAYSKFATYTILEHNGGWGAAAAQLARDGYTPAKERPLSRHASIPRLRVAPPAELDRYADTIVQEIVAPIHEAAEAARPDDPEADAAEWGNVKATLDLVEPAADVLGGLGDLDLIDYQAAGNMVRDAALPFEYLETLSQDSRDEQEASFNFRFLNGWNKGATAGHEVPAELRAALDRWHPPCPIPREDVEPHRLPPGRGGMWPARNFVSNTDDRGNARRLLDHHGDRIMFTHAPSGLGEHAFDGQRWLDTASGGPGLVTELADLAIEFLPVTEAMSLSVAVTGFDKDGPVSDRGRYWKWLNAQQSDARRAAMIRSAAALCGKRVAAAVFDADPRWLNTPSGEIDLGRPEIGDDGSWSAAEPIVFHKGRHFPEHRHTRITGAPYDSAAACPEFEAAMLAWLGDEAMVTYVGKLVAASVRGLVTLKLLVVLLGGRDSGKSTFLEVTMAVLGGYATTASPTILRKGTRSGSTLSDDLDDLRGFRFVTTTETAGSEEMDAARVKRLSGGDRARSRGLYKPSAEWDPFFVIWQGTNEMLRMPGADAALWSRLRPIRYPFMFTATGKTPGGEQCKVADPALKRKLLAESPGILAWIVRHLELLYRDGLAEPEAVSEERRQLQSHQDTVGMYLAAVEADSGTADELSHGIGAGKDRKIRFTRFLKHYATWAKKSEITPVGKDGFRQALENRHVKITKPGNVDTVHGFGHDPSHKFGCPVCDEPPAADPPAASCG